MRPSRRTPHGTLALIHTLARVIPEFTRLCGQIMPSARVVHLLDETILAGLLERGGLDQELTRRVSRLAVSAEEGGADVIMTTCSSISPSVDVLRQIVAVPVLKVDEPMADAAVRRGSSIGVAATLPTTLKPTVALLRQCARRRGKRIRIHQELCSEAFEAARRGDHDGHNRIVAEAVRQLAAKARTIVLAQASMAEAAGALELPEGVRLLSSPRLAVLAARRALEGACTGPGRKG